MDPNNITDGEMILAEKIISLLDDDKKASKYGDKAYERAMFYAPEKYKESIHEIFKRYE